MSGKKAKGIDAIGPIEIQRLPAPARQELADLYAMVERTGFWPPQIFAVLGAVAPKPKGGDRILGQLPFFMKLWSKIRYPLSERWSSELAEFWDSAVKGSSALQAALVRRCMDECCHALSIASGTILLDIEKFYDSISIPLVCQAGLRQDFLAITLAMELQMFLAPRHLRERKWASRSILPYRSLVAGSPHGGKLDKAMLGPVLQEAHQRYQLNVMMRTFVDDTVIRAEGTVEGVSDTLISAGGFIGRKSLMMLAWLFLTKLLLLAMENIQDSCCWAEGPRHTSQVCGHCGGPWRRYRRRTSSHQAQSQEQNGTSHKQI